MRRHGYAHSTIVQAAAELGQIELGVLLSLIILTARTLLVLRLKSGLTSTSHETNLFALLVCFLIADQIYGNYLMSAYSWFVFGLGGSLAAQAKKHVITEICPSKAPPVTAVSTASL